MGKEDRVRQLAPNRKIRASRYDELVPAYDLHLSYDEHRLQVLNISETGVRVEGKSNVFEKADANPISISTGTGSPLFEGFARVAWSEKNTTNSLTTYGLEFQSKYIPRDLLKALDQLIVLEMHIQTAKDSFESISVEFRTLVYEIRNFLSHLKREVDAIEDKLEIQSVATKESMILALDIRFGQYVTKHLLDYGSKLNAHIDALPENQKRIYSDFFKSELNEFYLQSPYARRAMEKPFGYAGDFEMMNQIYRHQYEGKSLFAKLMHKYTVSEAGAQSVRERKHVLANKIYEVISKTDRKKIKICSLACGPAQEIVHLLETQKIPEDKEIEIFLIDQDVEALLDARRNITSTTFNNSKINLKVHSWPLSIKQLIERGPLGNDFFDEKYDLIYSAGLFDYLLQPIAKMLVSVLFEQLEPRGRLLIGNFHPNSPTRAIGELSVDWRLVYRNEAEMKDLATHYPHKLSSDLRKVVLYLEIYNEDESS